MSWLDNILGSNAFKAIFPTQALAQGVTQAVTGMKPTQQYTTGAVGGAGIAGLGALMGSGAGMTPYMPASTPSMDMAGSTLGPGGLFSPLNPMGSSMGASAGPSSLAKAFQMARMLPSSQPQSNSAQQRQNQEMQMRLIYQMFPNLRPGASLSQGQGLQGGFHG